MQSLQCNRVVTFVRDVTRLELSSAQPKPQPQSQPQNLMSQVGASVSSAHLSFMLAAAFRNGRRIDPLQTRLKQGHHDEISSRPPCRPHSYYATTTRPTSCKIKACEGQGVSKANTSNPPRPQVPLAPGGNHNCRRRGPCCATRVAGTREQEREREQGRPAIVMSDKTGPLSAQWAIKSSRWHLTSHGYCKKIRVK